MATTVDAMPEETRTDLAVQDGIKYQSLSSGPPPRESCPGALFKPLLLSCWRLQADCQVLSVSIRSGTGSNHFYMDRKRYHLFGKPSQQDYQTPELYNCWNEAKQKQNQYFMKTMKIINYTISIFHILYQQGIRKRTDRMKDPFKNNLEEHSIRVGYQPLQSNLSPTLVQLFLG